MESVAVTPVTGVTNSKCHARHAPRHRDRDRDTRAPPLKGGPRCHACHAGLIFRGRRFSGIGRVTLGPGPVPSVGAATWSIRVQGPVRFRQHSGGAR